MRQGNSFDFVHLRQDCSTTMCYGKPERGGCIVSSVEKKRPLLKSSQSVPPPLRVIRTHMSVCIKIPLFTDFQGFVGSISVISYRLSSYGYHTRFSQVSCALCSLSRNVEVERTSTKTLFSSMSAMDCPRHLERPYPKINSLFRSILCN